MFRQVVDLDRKVERSATAQLHLRAHGAAALGARVRMVLDGSFPPVWKVTVPLRNNFALTRISRPKLPRFGNACGSG
jgi:hypothetical protein